MLTPAQVKNHQFSASGRGTYRAAEVDEFFAEVCSSYEQMFRENGELLKKIGLLADKIEEYRNDEDNIRVALLTAQRMADKIVKEAKANAEAVLSEADAKAKELTSSAQKGADETLSAAQNEAQLLTDHAKKNADEIVFEAERKAQEQLGAVKRSVMHESLVLEMTRKEVSNFRAGLISMYKSHIEMINQIPALAEEEQKKAEPAAEEKAEEKTEEVKAEEQTAESAQEETAEVQEETAEPAAEKIPAEPEIDPVEDIPEPEIEAEAEPEEPKEDAAQDVYFYGQFSFDRAEKEAEAAEEIAEDEADEDSSSPVGGFKISLDKIAGIGDDEGADDSEHEFDLFSDDAPEEDDHGEEPLSLKNLFRRK